jgi:hypothetical protein
MRIKSIVCFINSFVLLVAVGTTYGQERTVKPGKEIHYKVNDVIELSSISEVSLETASLSLKYDEKNQLFFYINPGFIKIINDKWCLMCAKTITIAPHIQVPVTLFDDSDVLPVLKGRKDTSVDKASGNLVFDTGKMQSPIQFIITRDDEVTLHKKGKTFIVIKGEVWLEDRYFERAK